MADLPKPSDLLKKGLPKPQDLLEKKNLVQNGSKTISEPLPTGSKPFQDQVDTKPTQYVKPKVKPKNISEAVEDDNNYLGAMYNSLIGSGSDFIGGLTRLVAKSQPYTSPILAANADIFGGKAEQIVEKLRSSSSSKEYEEKIQQGFDLTKGVFTKENAKAIPLMISRFAGDLGLAIPTAGASYIAQNYNQGLKEFDKAVGDRTTDDPVGLNNTRELFAIAYTTIGSAADKYSLGFLTKNNPVAKKVKESILKETVKELATKTTGKITADVIEETASRITKKSLNKFKSVGLKGLTSAGVEGGTESITGTGTDITKLATNILTDKEIFDSEEVSEDFWKNRLNEFGGGAVLGGAAGSAIRGIKSVDDMVAERVSSATNRDNVNAIADELMQDLKTRYDEGSLDADRYDEIIDNLNNYIKATESIPFDIGAKKRKEAIKSIVERDRVSEEIKAKQEQMNSYDESLMPQVQQELDILEAKKQSLNDNVVEAASDEKFTYSKDPEKDKWYKKLGEDGELEEISKQQYELETQSVPQPAQPKIETREDIIKEIRAAEAEMERTGDFADYKIKIDDLNARLENLVPEPEIEGESAQQAKEDVVITPETVSKPKIVVHATEGDSGFALSQFEGVDKNNIVQPEDVRAFVSDGKTKVIGEAKVDESGGTEISIAAPMEDVGGRPGGARYDITIPNGSTAKSQEIVDIIQAEHIKNRDKGDKQLIPRVTKLIKDYIDSRTPTEIIDTKPKEDAVQVETAGQVPVLTEATAGQEVEQGKPKSKVEGVTEEGAKAEEVKPETDIEKNKKRNSRYDELIEIPLKRNLNKEERSELNKIESDRESEKRKLIEPRYKNKEEFYDEVSDAILTNESGSAKMPNGYQAEVIDSYYNSTIRGYTTIAKVTKPNGSTFFVNVNTAENVEVGKFYGNKSKQEEVDAANKKLKVIGERKVQEGKGNWRKAFNDTTDPFRKADILRAIAEVSTDTNEQIDILEAAKGMPEESNIVEEIRRKQQATQEQTPAQQVEQFRAEEVKAKGSDSFLDEAESLFYSNPLIKKGVFEVFGNDGKQVGWVALIKVDSDTVDVDNVVSMTGGQKKGGGSQIMKIVTKNADRTGVTLTLVPEPLPRRAKEGFDTPEKLQAFYERYGFVKDKKKPTMTRKPQPVLPQTVEEQIAELRIKEQVELRNAIYNHDKYLTDNKVDRAKLTDAKDLKTFDEIYDKYDKLISPLLPKKETKVEEVAPTKEKVAPRLKPKVETRVKFKKAIELFNDISATKGGAKKSRLAAARRTFLEKNPSIKYIDDNWRKISDQLKAKGLIETKGNCP